MPSVRVLALVAALVVSVAVSATAAPRGDVVPLPATVADVSIATTERTYTTTDAEGKALDPTRWRVAKGSGNCCENYLTTTPQGRLLDFGGTYPYFSDDEGRTWKRVQPTTPLLSGEGTIAVAPNGDILGVGWDPYTGDHLQAFKYEAATDRWLWAEQPLHTPFYDREWIAVVPGPITVAGREHPYVVILRGGWPSKDVYFISTDGLTYARPSSKQVETAIVQATTKAFDPVVSAYSDFGQANIVSNLAPLGARAVLTGPDLLTGLPPARECTSGMWLAREDLLWSCYAPADAQSVKWDAVDSSGRLHAAVWSPSGSVQYLTSTDGGRTVDELPLPLPAGYEVLTPNHRDIKANAAVGVAALTVQARHSASSTSQVFVFVYRYVEEDEEGEEGEERLLLERVERVGRGDLRSGVGVASSDPRFDFSTLALLPDGRVAVSFNDSAHTRPAVAIELPREAPRVEPSPGADTGTPEEAPVPNAPGPRR